MDQFDPWPVVPRQIFTPYYRLLISTGFVIVIRVSCLRVTSVMQSDLILLGFAQRHLCLNAE